ncbi:DUF397 domain-containing protein [Actinomadura alba]|uniref:DUF397 domain-containing protein n=1 Tax=Actinomadura alba TaxID=406431 RepID=A0ABR7LII8_9ACTN|nr:DUF397 domain-containing protein [Actinomadura alba]MBC6464642.1 DUF397 domain-containing protein [Actinomadura alba]
MSTLDNLSAIHWRKSSYSDSSHGDCVEVGAVPWHKSSYSGSSGGACVEIADLSRMIAVRDSKDVDGPMLAFGRSAFRTFVGEIRTGRYDR